MNLGPTPFILSIEETVSPALFHNRTGDDWPKTEQNWHRTALYLVAAGTPSKDVATACEVTVQSVYKLLKAPWFQQKLDDKLKENGATDIMALFKAEAINSVVTLVELRDGGKNEAVRKSAATEILDRYMGKPKQTIEATTTVRSDDPVEEAARLERENAMLEGRANG